MLGIILWFCCLLSCTNAQFASICAKSAIMIRSHREKHFNRSANRSVSETNSTFVCLLGSQYSDYMMLDYSCLQGESLSICENRLVRTSASSERQHRALIRSPNYPNEYDNSLNCSCQVETTTTSRIEFLDFYLEERDEINTCSRDYLQIANRSFCDSRIDEQDQSPSIDLNSSSLLTFKSNDVITRKGFWLMIISAQPIQVTCRNALEPSLPPPLPSPTVVYKSLSTTSLTPTTTTSRSSSTRRYTLSFILIVIIVFVITLLLVNLILVTLCCRQRRRRSKESINSKNSSTRRPFFCSKRSSDSSSSSITYHETPVLHALDPHKRLPASGRLFFGTRQHSESTPSTSITTAATGVYEDPNELMTLQRQAKVDQNHSLYIERPQEPMTFCPIVLSSCSTTAGYNRMFHYSSIPFHCHCKTSAAPSTFYPPQEHCSCDAQHVYETIKDGYCPYQRFAATLRREPSSQCTCHCPTHTEQTLPGRPDGKESNSIVAINPETLV